MSIRNIEALIDPNLQAKLHRAQDALTEKREQIDGLKEVVARAQSALESDRTALAQAEDKLRTATTGHKGNADAIETAMTAARKVKGEVMARVQQGEERVKDLSDGLRYQEAECKELVTLRDKARMHLVRHLKLQIEPPKHGGRKSPFEELFSFNIDDFMCAWMVHNEVAGRAAHSVNDTGKFTHNFLSFMIQYFANPSDEDVNIIRNRYDGLIWGDYEPPLEKRGRNQAGNQVNADLVDPDLLAAS